MWLDSLFITLGSVYGSRFTNQWPAAVVDTVKKEWARELAPFENKPDALQYAVDSLPADHVPNVLEIRDACRRFCNPSTRPTFKPLSAEERAHALNVLGSWTPQAPTDAREWARRLRLRELQGERLSRYQREAWREAIHASEK